MSLGESAAGPFLGRFHQNPIFFGGLFPSAHLAAPEIGLTPVTRWKFKLENKLRKRRPLQFVDGCDHSDPQSADHGF